ncbi:MAG: hypothetical protein COX29_04240 [Candidatus Moranbacteria bacterium CG23_combo_of_CG06-09_8_20_14_all_35_22]|nr:MAG: hypothetical protein COX29_04240 [Candidatus Moranbacteria bacterium CG23_combo_of_CG06-09_8_20_14_all_35_22]
MTKKELIWREILFQGQENKIFEFTQKELAEKFGFSLSTIFNALKIPRATGAISVSGRNFTVRSLEKFLYIWATQRNLKKEIIYETHTNMSAKEMEGLAPDGIIFGTYSAYSQKYLSAPAEYDKVYFYAEPEKLAEIEKRFPKLKGYANFFVLKADPYLSNFAPFTPDVQTFCDLWNLPDWQAKEFLEKLKNKIILT